MVYADRDLQSKICSINAAVRSLSVLRELNRNGLAFTLLAVI